MHSPLNSTRSGVLLLIFFFVGAQSFARQKPSITINGGDKFTNTVHVKLTVEGEDAVEMNISNTPALPDNKWIDYNPNIASWILEEGDGNKTVYAKLRFKNGTESEILTDEIILDSTPPESPTIEIDHPSEYINDPRLEVGLNISAIGAKYIMISNHENFYGQRWRSFTDNYYDWKLEKGDDGHRFVYVKFRDLAGNETQPIHDHVIFDKTPPYAAQIEINGGQKYCIMQNGMVKLAIDGRGADSMMVANDSEFTDAQWQVYQEELEWGLPKGDGRKTVFVKFKDFATNESNVIKDDILLDTTPPQNGEIMINGGAKRTTDINKKVTLSFKADGAFKLLVSNKSSFSDAKWRFFMPKIAGWQLDGESDGIRSVYVKFMDEAGNVSKAHKADISLERGF